MRIRSIKPEFYRSEDIASLEWNDRLLFIALWSYVDDNGVGVDRLADVAADLFALDLERDPSETFARVSRGLQALCDAGLILRYKVDGKAYLAVANFSKHQRIDRPNKARFPGPDQAECDTLAIPSRHPRETPATGAEEQRNRGTEEELLSPAQAPRTRNQYPADFEAFWKAYPKKAGKAEACRQWKTARRSVSNETLIEAATRYAEDPNRDPQYTKDPERWLKKGSWDDDPLPLRRSVNKPTPDERAAGWLVAGQRVQERIDAGFSLRAVEG